MRTATLISLSILLALGFQSALAIEPTPLVKSAAMVNNTKILQSRVIEIVLYDKSAKENSRPVRVQDVDSKKMAQAQLVKPESNANFWTGTFIIHFFRGDNKPRTLEFLSSAGQAYYVHSIQEKNSQKVVLFPTTAQLADYVKKLEPSQKTQAEAIQPKTQAEVVRDVQDKAREQEKVQLSFEEDQAKNRSALLEKFARLSEAEKTKRGNQAGQLAKAADAHLAKNEFNEAAKKYLEASNLNPEQEVYYYKYAVCLYKTDDYNKSLAVFSLAEAPEGLELEKEYYLALNYLKLKDYEKAHKKLNEIRSENDPNLSPISSYYAGTVEMFQQKFPEARKSMEYVLDNSKDPELDKTAEAALGQIDKLENFYLKSKEILRFTVFGGLVYDENILNVASNNVATDVKGYRVNYGFSALGFWFIKEDSDLGTQLTVSDYYSLDTQFKGDANLQTSDPLEFALTVPYNRQISSMRWNLEPYIRSIYMSAVGGTRKEVIRSTGASTTLSSSIKPTLYLSGKLDYSVDSSKLQVTNSADDLSANKISLTVTPTLLLDLKGEKTLSPEVSYLLNQAKGENYRYAKTGFAVTYGFPALTTAASARLDYATQRYADATDARTDTTTSLTLAANKDLNKKWNLNLSAQYNSAQSSVELYKYNKFVLTSLLTYTTSIFGK